MFDHYFRFASLQRSFALYFVTLILKTDSSTRLGDFPPISLIISLYKLVADILDDRSSIIIDIIVSSN